jgi:hypothetical protein
MKRVVTAVVVASLVAACGAQPETKGPVAPSSPANASPAPAREELMAPAGASPSPPASAPMAPPEPSPSAPSTALRPPEAGSAGDLEAAERDVASPDCPTACRALGSMERAIVFLCATLQSDSDRGHCVDSKRRLVAARRRVAATCGTCSNVSVDPDAPVPSR